MEFLDDLRERREAKTLPQPQPEASSPAPARPVPEIPEAPEAWDELLEGVDFDEPTEVIEPPAANGKSRARSRRRRFSTGQVIVLAVMGIAVLAFWAVLILFITGAFHTSSIDLEPESDVASAVNSESDLAVAEVTSTAPALSETTTVANDPLTPTATPVPAGPIATIYDEQIRKDPDNATLYLQRGSVYLDAGASDAALSDFERARDLQAGGAAYLGIGHATYALFRWQDAEAAFGQAIALDPEMAEAHYGLGLIHYYRGDYRKAGRSFDMAAEINPDHAEYEAWLAIAAAHFNDRPEALGAATRAISASADLPLVYVAKSWAARVPDRDNADARDVDGAQGDLLHALDLGPNDFLTLNAVAEFYVAERPERLAEAEQLAAYALNWAKNAVERAVALQTLGRVYLLQERSADAQRVLEEAMALASVDGDVALTGLEEDLARTQQ